MKNIFMIFITDFKKIKTNVVAIVVIMGLAVIPSLYAWFNILSNWDPYGPESTGKIKVAVASDDIGTSLGDKYFNMGESVVEALESNDTIGWVFPDTTEDAIEGVYKGDYYAALVIPENFTSDLISVLTDEVENPTIDYYENEKKNAIAPKITAKAKTSVQQQVNKTFISTLSGTMTTALDAVVGTDEMEAIGITDASSLVDVLIIKLNDALDEVEVLESLVDSLVLVTDSLVVTADAAENLETIDNVMDWSDETLNSAQGKLNYGIIGRMSIARTLSYSLATIQGTLKTLSASSEVAEETMGMFNENINYLNETVKETQLLIAEMKLNILKSIEELEEIRDGENYEMLLQLITSDSDTVGSFVSNPVELTNVRIFPVEYYGSQMAPFYTTLAIWVGSLILVAIIHVAVHPRKGVKKPTNVEKFFGRYLTFYCVGQLQALLTVLGDLYFVQIQCEDVFKLWLAASVTSLTFTIIIYSLTFAFGNVGEGAAVIFMVIQVAGAGCTFPIQVLPEVFQSIYKFLPFVYAMDAMRECVGGFYENYYWECIGHLLLFIPIFVILGIVGGKYFKKMNNLIEKNKEGSGIMI